MVNNHFDQLRKSFPYGIQHGGWLDRLGVVDRHTSFDYRTSFDVPNCRASFQLGHREFWCNTVINLSHVSEFIVKVI